MMNVNDLSRGYNAYKMGHALKLHFRTNYDYHKYHGKSKCKSFDDFVGWKHISWKWVSIANKFPNKKILEDYYVSQYVINTDSDIYNFSDEDYYKWLGRLESFDYSFKEEIKSLLKIDSLQNVFKSKPGTHPSIMKALFSSIISLETFIVLTDGVKWFEKMKDEELLNDFMYKELYQRCKKYKPFLKKYMNSTKHYGRIIGELLKETY